MSKFAAVLALFLLLSVATIAEGHKIGRRHVHIKAKKNKPKPKPVEEEPKHQVVYNTLYPFACTVNVTSYDGLLCSGTLVNEKYVVTSASCAGTADVSDITIFCDASDFTYYAKEIVVPEAWLGIKTLDNDIAMIELDEPSDLPVATMAEPDTILKYGGLFSLETDQKDIAIQKRKDVTYMGWYECNSTYFWTNSIQTSYLCIVPPTNECISDTGAGLYFTPTDEKEPTMLVGVASFDTKFCIRHTFPIIFTSISAHRDFIDSVIAGKNKRGSDADDAKAEKKKIANVTAEFKSKNSTEVAMGALEAIFADDSLMLSVLLDLGLEVDARVDDYNRTLLHYSAQYGAHKCARLLVAYGANVSILEDEAGATPLHFAATSGFVPVAKVLLEAGAYVNDVDNNHLTPLHYNLKSPHGRMIMFKFLMEAGANVHEVDKFDATPLHYAAAADWVAAIKFLVKAGANLIVYAKDGGAPLHWAARDGADFAVKEILNDGAHIEAQPKFALKETALSFAVRFEAPLTTIKILLERGANPNVADKKGYTPLHRAVESNRFKVIKILVEYGANTTTENAKGRTALQVYCRNHDCSEGKGQKVAALLTP